jgi:hypothetical protein
MRVNFNPPAAREQHRYIATAGAFKKRKQPPPTKTQTIKINKNGIKFKQNGKFKDIV